MGLVLLFLVFFGKFCGIDIEFVVCWCRGYVFVISEVGGDGWIFY